MTNLLGSGAAAPAPTPATARFGWKKALVWGGLLLLVVLLSPAGIWWIRAAVFSHLIEKIADLTHLNGRFVTAAVVVLGFPFLWAVQYLLLPHLPAVLREQRKAKTRRTRVAYTLLFGYVVLFYLVTGFVTRDLYFDRKGNPLKWCVERPSELYCEDAPGFDPNGVLLTAVTKEMADRHRLRGLGELPNRMTFTSSQALDAGRFFGADGRPEIWFGRSLTGEIDFFDGPGYHPVTGRALEGVSAELLRSLRAEMVKQEEEAARKARAEAERLAELARQAELDRQRELELLAAEALHLWTPPEAGARWQQEAEHPSALPAEPPSPGPALPSFATAAAPVAGGGCFVLRSELAEPITVAVDRADREIDHVYVPAGATVRVGGAPGREVRVRAPGNPRQGWRKDLSVTVPTPPDCASSLLLRRSLRAGDPIQLIGSSSATGS